MRTLVLTALTMAAFAANSLLTRGALGHDLIDAPSFTLIRLATGAAALAILSRSSGLARRSRKAKAGPAGLSALALAKAGPEGLPAVASAKAGSWLSGLWLAGYAVAFTLAYTRIGAGVGALLLFGAVQATMIGAGVVGGHRPHARDWVGLALAMAGLAWLTLPGATAPDALGAALMIAAGASWGAYSIAGRGSRDPLAATTGNFWRAALLGAAALGLLVDPGRATATGLLMAAVSGAIASGLGYTVWYSVLPALGAWRAALVQLTVPVLTGLGATIFLGESIPPRLFIAGGLVAAGVALTMAGQRSEVKGQRSGTS